MNVVSILSICIWFCIGCFLVFGTPLGAIMLSIGLIYLAISFILGLIVFVAALFKD